MTTHPAQKSHVCLLARDVEMDDVCLGSGESLLSALDSSENSRQKASVTHLFDVFSRETVL